MRKFLFFSLLLLGTHSVVSCQSSSTAVGEGVPVEIVFEKWQMQFGQVKGIDVSLKGKNQSGEPVEVKTSLLVNQYDEFLLPMLTELEDKNQLKDGIGGFGLVKAGQESARGKLFITKVGNVATENMEFFLDEKEVAVFSK